MPSDTSSQTSWTLSGELTRDDFVDHYRHVALTTDGARELAAAGVAASWTPWVWLFALIFSASSGWFSTSKFAAVLVFGFVIMLYTLWIGNPYRPSMRALAKRQRIIDRGVELYRKALEASGAYATPTPMRLAVDAAGIKW